ncbi:MAG: PilZ domain-containing protein [Thermodesulfobacteriota bacterium]
MEKNLATEKRKYPRINVDLPVKYSRTNLFFKYGQAINASEGGLLVSFAEKIEIGQHLALKLFFPSRSELNIIEAIVQVVWMDIHLRKDWTWDYRTGVRFEDISPENMSIFKNFLMSNAQKPPCNA